MLLRAAVLVACTGALISVSTIPLLGQSPRVALAAGVAAYNVTHDTTQTGLVARLTLNLESADDPLALQVEGAYHRFFARGWTVPTLPCLAPGCVGYYANPAFDLWTGEARGLYHFRGVPGGFYLGVGLGVYISGAHPGATAGASWGYDVGLGLRPARHGFFAEIRFVRLPDRPLPSSFFPLTVGFLF